MVSSMLSMGMRGLPWSCLFKLKWVLRFPFLTFVCVICSCKSCQNVDTILGGHQAGKAYLVNLKTFEARTATSGMKKKPCVERE